MLGIGWRVLIPLCQLALLVLIFGSVVPLGIPDYPPYIYSGLLPWLWFNNSIATSGYLFITNRDLLRKPGFSPMVLVVTNTLSNFITFLLSLPILILLLGWYGRPITMTVLYLPLILAVHSMLIFGLSLIIATYNVFYRDVAHLVSVVLPMLFFVTPVFYRPVVQAELGFWFQLNPMAPLVDSYRSILFLGQAPNFGIIMISAIISGVIATVGYLSYKRRLSDIVDIL